MSLIEINWNPDRNQLRAFAWIWLLGFTAVGVLVAWRVGAFSNPSSWRAPVAVWAVAAIGCVLSLISTSAARALYRAWMAASFPIGWTVSHLMLIVVYFGLFTGTAFVMRLLGRDPMQRKFDRNRESYWVQRPETPPVEQYFKQF